MQLIKQLCLVSLQRGVVAGAIWPVGPVLKVPYATYRCGPSEMRSVLPLTAATL